MLPYCKFCIASVHSVKSVVWLYIKSVFISVFCFCFFQFVFCMCNMRVLCVYSVSLPCMCDVLYPSWLLILSVCACAVVEKDVRCSLARISLCGVTRDWLYDRLFGGGDRVGERAAVSLKCVVHDP